MIVLIIAALTALGLATAFFFATYTVVDPNEAHVVVFMGRGRRLYSAKGKDGGSKTSYFYIPFLMKRNVLPLTNVKMDIENIHLHDSNVAPFICDVVTWLHIENPIQAAERLNLSQPFESLQMDLLNLVQAVSRAAAMKQEIFEKQINPRYAVEFVLDDRDQVVEMWRSLGIQCFQVAEGNF